MHNNSFQVSTIMMHLRPVQLRLSPAELHHPESQLNVLWLGQIFHLGLIQACVDYHRGVVHGLLIVSAKQLPVRVDRITNIKYSCDFGVKQKDEGEILAHRTYRKRSGKLIIQMSSLHNWLPTARLPRNWMPQRRAEPQKTDQK